MPRPPWTYTVLPGAGAWAPSPSRSVVVIPLLSLSIATRRGRTDGIDELTSWMPVHTAGWIEARPSPALP
ncbi:hypothetical protein OHB24_33550 [Kribbella sp. NBC_00482]|uniref:hypothetical protein n=1 Tax=Kribbella sp. NBC_00482 TaxID=2975968 RepID=UPI002E17CA70